MNRSSLLAPLYAFLLACTLIMTIFCPAYAIFPVLILFCVLTAVFFQPINTGQPIEPAPPPPPPDCSRYAFEGDFSPYAFSRLALLDHTMRRRCGKPLRPDDEIAADVAASLAADPTLNLYRILAFSRFGRVTLQGQVQTEGEKAKARELACEVNGVLDVSVQVAVVLTERAG